MTRPPSRRDVIQIGGLGLAGLLLPGVGCSGQLRVQGTVQARKLSYPPSEIFSGLEWLAPAMRYPGTDSDMHWWTWGADDALYVVDDDGNNFDFAPDWKNYLRVTGSPPHHKVVEISQFPGLKLTGPEFGKNGKRRVFNDDENSNRTRYVCGSLAVGSRLYVAVYDYNNDVRGKSRDFIDRISPNAGIVALIYSDDGGKTWENIPSKDHPNAEKPYFLGQRFAGLQFVGFGPGYSDLPPDVAGYVYAISNDDNWASGDHVFLARAPLDQVLKRRAWEFYAGEGKGHRATRPVWVSEEERAKPILSDPKHVGHPDMTYNKTLGRYFLSVFSDGVPHSLETPFDVAMKTWDKRAELQIYEGPSPWGPWKVGLNDPAWEGPKHVPYLPHIPSKWWSADGLSGILLFSGDYTDNGPTPHVSQDSYYGFMTRPFRLVRSVARER